MDNKDRIIDKLKDLVEHYKAYYDSTKSPAVKILPGWEKYGDELESELASLEREKEEVITPSPIRRANDMVQFILDIDFMTTVEFCKAYDVPLPKWTGNVQSSADQFLQIDAIKHRMFVEYAKKLKQSEQKATPEAEVMDELIKLVRIARKGSHVSTGNSTYWEFDIDSEKKVVDEYLNSKENK